MSNSNNTHHELSTPTNGPVVLDQHTAAEILLSVSPVMGVRETPNAMKLDTLGTFTLYPRDKMNLMHMIASLADVELRSQEDLDAKKFDDSKMLTKEQMADLMKRYETKGACPKDLALVYGEIYNKFGRYVLIVRCRHSVVILLYSIGIYNTQQREKLLDNFKGKRSRRIWKKKIRYGCRKNLADQRIRIKGRFVKLEEQETFFRPVQ